MKHIKALLHKHKTAPTIVTQDLQDPLDHQKVHILYFSPYLNASGYYRMILPYFEFNKTTTHSARITSLSKLNFTKNFHLDSIQIDTELILWADYIIFSMLTEDYTYLLKRIKAIHPEVELVMDIDQALHKIPVEYPIHKKVDAIAKENLLKNMGLMNLITGNNAMVLQLYYEVLEHYNPEHEIVFEQLPDLISPTGYQDIQLQENQKESPVRIGILSTLLFQGEDVLTLKTLLLKLHATYKQSIVLICIGWNGKLRDGTTPLQSIPITYVKPVSFIKYFKMIHELHLDMALLPVLGVAYERYSSYRNYLELSALKIPVITVKSSVYGRIIHHEQTGVLVSSLEDWEVQVKRLIADVTYRRKIGNNAFQNVHTHHGFNPKNVRMLKEVFL